MYEAWDVPQLMNRVTQHSGSSVADIFDLSENYYVYFSSVSHEV